MVRRGNYAVRLGAIVEEPLPTSDLGIIDYATTNRSDFMDIYPPDRLVHRSFGSRQDHNLNNRLIVELRQDSLAEYDVILVPVISPFTDSRAHPKQILGEAMSEI